MLIAALSLLLPLAHAAPEEVDPPSTDSGETPAQSPAEEVAPGMDRRFGVGARVGVWGGAGAAPMIGGQLTFRPFERLRVLTFADHALKGLDDTVQMDHVIGFHLIVPALRWTGGSVGPVLGSCVDFRMWRDRSSLELQRADVLFGPRMGVHVEQDVTEHWSLQGSATAVMYIGNTAETYGWGGRADGLETTGLVQAQVGITRWW